MAPIAIDGRVYYASVDYSTMRVMRLSHLNAETIDDELPALLAAVDASTRQLILHKNNFEDEMQSARCTFAGVGVNEHCMAYGDAVNVAADIDAYSVSGTAIKGGADDLNMCLYTDKVGTTGAYNKYGAAATFGPTMADLVTMRDGTLALIQANLNTLIVNSSNEFAARDGLRTGVSLFNKNFMHTHFVNSPAPADFDLETSFAVIFPFMHFINEAPKLGTLVLYDMDETTVTAPSSGFISPGLPVGLAANEEAFLQTLTGTFPEGWIKIGKVTATNATSTTATDPGAATTATNTLVGAASTGGSYLPGYTGAAFVHGGDSVSSSLLNYFEW